MFTIDTTTTASIAPTDRDRVKECLSALRRMGIAARYAWMGRDFAGVQVNKMSAPVSHLYGPDGSLLSALELVCPTDLLRYLVPAVERAGLEAETLESGEVSFVLVRHAGSTV